MASPEERLAELGISLPKPPAPAAASVPTMQVGSLLFTAGQVPVAEGSLVAEGIVGDSVDMDTAVACARQCAINVIAQVKAAVIELSRVRQVVKLTVFVASTPTFTQQHLVANGASELMAEVFGDIGRHARSAVGVPSLPTNAPVEVEAVFDVV